MRYEREARARPSTRAQAEVRAAPLRPVVHGNSKRLIVVDVNNITCNTWPNSHRRCSQRPRIDITSKRCRAERGLDVWTANVRCEEEVVTMVECIKTWNVDRLRPRFEVRRWCRRPQVNRACSGPVFLSLASAARGDRNRGFIDYLVDSSLRKEREPCGEVDMRSWHACDSKLRYFARSVEVTNQNFPTAKTWYTKFSLPVS
ncbi:hypothetical protein EVAR_76927_1 [Eumeta japonica]|uniref:Uncharacterized protein n=1 Tax=Eumeta variegata TaxID=151549 RepID=A0A4C1SFK1_EUMVA|nr:hypothetical protein EVAR_76927_1 [Eumeta japonica]